MLTPVSRPCEEWSLKIGTIPRYYDVSVNIVIYMLATIVMTLILIFIMFLVIMFIVYFDYMLSIVSHPVLKTKPDLTYVCLGSQHIQQHNE